MNKYDEERDLLILSQIPVEEKSTVYPTSYMYESYMDYIENQWLTDIEELLIKPLDAAMATSCKLVLDKNIYIPTDGKTGKKKMRVVYDNTVTYKGWAYYSAFISLGCLAYIKGTKEFCIMKIPVMDKFGVIHRDGKEYALIGSLVQDDAITFDNTKAHETELKIVTEGGNFYNIKHSAGKVYMEFGSDKVNVADVLTALAVRDGYDVKDILTQAMSIPIIRDTKGINIEYCEMYSADVYAGLMERIANKKYKLGKVRKMMNSVLSLDRAIGKSTSQQLVSGSVKIAADTLITTNMLNRLKLSKCCAIPTEYIPNLDGTWLAQSVTLNHMRKGTELSDELRAYFPENKGKYMNQTVWNIKPGIVIPTGTVVTDKLVQMLIYNGVQDIVITDRENDMSRARTVYFSVSVMSNHCIECSKFGLDFDTEYAIIDGDRLVPFDGEQLTAYDVLAMLSLYDRLIVGEDLGTIANKDLGFRKKVKLAKEYFHTAMEKACAEMIPYVKNTMINRISTETGALKASDLDSPDKMETLFYKLSEKWWKYLYKMKVVNIIDKTNPVSYYSSLEKINTIVKSAHAVTDSMRWMSMGHYGRLCPYEIPQGGKLGVVNNIAICARIRNGKLETPYRRVKRVGQRVFLSDEIRYMTVEEEENYRIADILSLELDANNEIKNTGRVLARVPTNNALEKVSVAKIDIQYIEWVNVDPQQSMSAACALIPFMGADDAARVTFEISQSKQAKPLLWNELPYVMTSANNDIIRKSPFFMVQAEYDGEVLEATADYVLVKYDDIDEPVSYEFKQTEFSTDSVIIRTVEVKAGDRVKAGQTLVTSNYVIDGTLAITVNALVCTCPKGYNYEDGMYGADRLRYKLTAYSALTEEEPIAKSLSSAEPYPANKFSYVQPGQKIYQLVTVKKKASHAVKKFVTSKKMIGFITDVSNKVDQYTRRKTAIETHAVAFDYAHEGDKEANRHGNKGVAPMLVPNSQMLRLKNGEFFDIVYNPMGISSRMNIGQVKEWHLGLAAMVLRTRFQSDPFNGASVKDVERILLFAWRLANEDDAEAVINDFPEYDLRWRRKRLEHLDWIRSWRGVFNPDGTAEVYDPRTGRFLEEPVVIGVNALMKLVQEVDHKIHARGGLINSRYVKKGSGPTKGASNGGGQRMGEMEIAAFAAYGAAATINEMLNARGDNPVARCNLTTDAIFGEDNPLHLPDETGMRRSVEEFICTNEALGVKIEFEGELPNMTRAECDSKRVWSRSAIMNQLPKKGTRKQKQSIEDFAADIRD